MQDDGIIKLEVLDPVATSFNGHTETLCKVANKNDVTLGARKGVNLPGVVLDLPAITERDKRVRMCFSVIKKQGFTDWR